MRLTNTSQGQISRILRELKIESDHGYYDFDFEQWCAKEWGIVWLHENASFPSHLTGLEMSDETYTMLILKFGITADGVSA